MSTFENASTGNRAATGLSLDLVQRTVLWLWIASGWYVIVEPAPFEYLFLLTLAVMLPAGLNFHRATVPLILFLLAYNIGGAFSMLPHMEDSEVVKFVYVSFYMAVFGMFIANLIADDTMRRFEVIKNAYIIAAVLGSIMGMIGYFDIFGMAAEWAPILRAQGTFKDPNVLSTFLIAPAVFIIQGFLLGRQKWPILSAIALLIIVAGVFFAYSRGAWVSSMASVMALVVLMVIQTPSPQLRSRIILLCIFGLIAFVGLFFVALSFEFVRNLFLERANFLNSYDAGETGRFGLQVRSLPVLLDSPNGFGPRQFSKLFGADPHNVYINAFASYGWLGGFTYLILVISTIVIGIKTIFTRTPWQAYAIAVFCPLFFTILQGIQIDTDHWRHFYLLLGLMWGFYAATERYSAKHRTTEQS